MKDAEGNPISEITVSQKMFEPISILNRSQNIQYSFLGVLTIYIYTIIPSPNMKNIRLSIGC